MGRSGLATILLLVMTIVIVMLAAGGSTGGISQWWARITGSSETAPATHEVTSPQNMNSSDGMRQVEQAQRDMQRMDSLANSIR